MAWSKRDLLLDRRGPGESWLFPAVSPAALGTVRLLFFAWLFVFYANSEIALRADLPAAMREPQGLFKLGVPWPSVGVAAAIELAFKASLLTSALGLLTRLSVGVALVSGFATLSLLHSFGKVNHSDAALLFVIGVLFWSRCGDAVSLDALWRKPRDLAARKAEGAYGWPFVLARLTLSAAFLAAGVAKVRVDAMQWVDGSVLRNHLLRTAQSHDPWLPSLGTWVAGQPWLCAIAGIGTLVVELLFPLGLISPLARLLLVPAAVSMQLGILAAMGDDFRQYVSLYLFWLPTALLATVGGARRGLSPARAVS